MEHSYFYLWNMVAPDLCVVMWTKGIIALLCIESFLQLSDLGHSGWVHQLHLFVLLWKRCSAVKAEQRLKTLIFNQIKVFI